MERITVIIESGGNNLSAYLDGIDGIVVVGDTVEEIMRSMREAIDFSVEVSREIGEPVPERIAGEYELDYVMADGKTYD